MGGRGKYSRSGPRQSLFPANHDAPTASLPLPTYPFRHALAPSPVADHQHPKPPCRVWVPSSRCCHRHHHCHYCRLCCCCLLALDKIEMALLLSSPPGHLPQTRRRLVVVTAHAHAHAHMLLTHTHIHTPSLVLSPSPTHHPHRTHGRRDTLRRRAGARSVEQPLAWLSALECPMSQWTGATGRF